MSASITQVWIDRIVEKAERMFSSFVDWVDHLARSPWYYLIVYAIACSTRSSRSCRVRPSRSSVASPPARTEVALGCDHRRAVGALCGDNLAYVIGGRASVWLERRRAENRKRSRLDWAARQLKKRGGVLILTARFIPGGRTAVTIMSGVTHQRWLKFFFFTVVAGAAWASYAALLGYFGGQRFEDNHTAAFILAFGMAIAVSLVIELGRYVWHRRHPSATTSEVISSA
jgi:membrane protein YqaA with SNARE-associated domain